MSHAQSAQRDLMIKTLWKIIFQYKRTYVDSVERRTHAFRNSFIIFHPELIFLILIPSVLLYAFYTAHFFLILLFHYRD